MKLYVTCLLLLLIGLFRSHSGFGQADDRVMLQGEVVDADSLYALPYVHIREKNDRLGGATDVRGRFQVGVNRSDTIVFTSVGYESVFLVPADSTDASLGNLTIAMKPQVNQLQEVTVKAYDDITKLIRPKEESFSLERSKGTPLFERKEPEEQKAVGTAGGLNGASLEGGLTALANLFNNDFQQRKKLKELLAAKEAEEQARYLRVIMTKKYQEMVVQAADLSVSDLHQFTRAYMPPPRVMLDMDEYSLMLGILDNLKRFQPEIERRLAIEKLLKSKKFEGGSPSEQ